MAIPKCRNTRYKLKSGIQISTEVEVQKHWHQNILKVLKRKSFIMQNVPLQNTVDDVIGL